MEGATRQASRENRLGGIGHYVYAMRLATITTGRGGSGSPQAKAEQMKIARLLEQHGATGIG